MESDSRFHFPVDPNDGNVRIYKNTSCAPMMRGLHFQSSLFEYDERTQREEAKFPIFLECLAGESLRQSFANTLKGTPMPALGAPGPQRGRVSLDT